jgi:DNA repair protein SbcD/Mre11
MKTRTTLLHTSDIHLDNTLGGAGDESPGQLGLMHVVDKALALDVDLFLLAGDLFDHNRVNSRCLEFASEQLARLRCPVVMVTGNHDCLTDYSVYHRYDPTEAGDHIHFIREEGGAVVQAAGVNVWGKGIVDHHPGNKPLQLVPPAEGEGWYLGVTHGYYINRGATMYSSLITPDEVEASGLDYLALGHVHVFSTWQHGKTHAAYPGSPNVIQGTRERTAAYVVLDPKKGVIIDCISVD